VISITLASRGLLNGGTRPTQSLVTSGFITRDGKHVINAPLSEQLSEAEFVTTSGAQGTVILVAQSVNQALIVDVENGGPQPLSTSTAEQLAEVSPFVAIEALHLKPIVTEQLSELSPFAAIEALHLKPIATEQFTNFGEPKVDNVSTVSVLSAEQLVEASTADVGFPLSVHLVTTEQLSTYTLLSTGYNLSVLAPVSYQYSQNEVVAIGNYNVSDRLKLDVDRVSFSKVAPHRFEAIAPNYKFHTNPNPVYTFLHLH